MRIRTIKPEFFTHEGIFTAEAETGLPLRLAFAGLWCACDREGRFKWEPRRLGVQILPYDALDFSRVLHALVTRGFVVKYRVGDACFGCVPSFPRHQVINNRESESSFPGPDAEGAETLGFDGENDACPTRASRVPHAGKAEGKGREGNMEGKGDEPSALSGKPDAAIPAKTRRMMTARPVLLLLNEITGRGFRETESNLLQIAARLEEKGVTLEGVMQMVRRQCKKWGTDPEMVEYLRPSTLFRRSKFDSYYASREMPVDFDNHNGQQRPLIGTSTADDSKF